MSTFAYDLANSIDERLEEVDILILKADEFKETDEEFYNALCRSSIVLLTGHFEGFVKESAKTIVHDINRFSSFKFAPNPIKRTFCNSFIDISDAANQKRLNSLIDTFDNLDTELKPEPFLYEANDGNKNPSPKVVEKILKNFGVTDFFGVLNSSLLDDVFKNDKSETESILNLLKEHVIAGVQSYPYSLDPNRFQLQSGRRRTQDRTLWETFLDNLLRRRHSIAHGTIIYNEDSSDEIKSIKTKLQVLHYAYMLVLFNQCNITSSQGDSSAII
ncbi:MAE_28990/MAE_18760 family HEPN-like nuclease [Paenibacillus chitinolyticus]|uniref:MAE_28990/MAE_18760 family HEPN-like nuclease n=1 Tax=Paenibacillus chitinolyticus TaxID=79263 RepID=UPI0035DE7A02